MTLNTVTISEEICAYIPNIFVSICKFPINKFRNYLYPHVMVTFNCLPGITQKKSLWECLNYINRRKICPPWAALFPESGVLGCLSVERGWCTTVHCPSTLLHVVTKVVKWPVLSSSCCVTSLQWWPLTYDCDLNKLSRCLFYIIIATGTETHQKTKQDFSESAQFLCFSGSLCSLGVA